MPLQDMPCASLYPAAAPLPLVSMHTGTMLGVLFIIIGLKLSLGTAGIIPSLNIPGGLISFAAIKSMAAVGSSLQMHARAPLAHRLLFQPFGLQENAVMQTFVLSMGTGGFGSYITGGKCRRLVLLRMQAAGLRGLEQRRGCVPCRALQNVAGTADTSSAEYRHSHSRKYLHGPAAQSSSRL